MGTQQETVMRKTVLTAVIAGLVGLSAGVWLKSTVLATAAMVQAQPAMAITPFELMRSAPRNLPATEVSDYM
jgi:hypothetical protein